MTKVLLPIRTWSEANQRVHWAKRARRAHRQREAARILVRTALAPGPVAEAIIVTLTRIAPRKLDSDNLAGALKAVRDGVADALGMDDGDPCIEWRYAQGKGKPSEYAVLVEIV